MIVLPAILKTKAFLFTAGGLLLLLAVTSTALWVQTERLSAAQTSLKSTTASLTLATQIASQRATELQGRDKVIQAQTDSIDALQASKGLSRVIYMDGVAKANTAAVLNETKAAEMVAADPSVGPDGYCEAARELIEQELLNVR